MNDERQPDVLRVAAPRETQLATLNPLHATVTATHAQPISLKALALRVLERNNVRNPSATPPEKPRNVGATGLTGKVAGDPDATQAITEYVTERAAIMEYDGGLSRNEAEAAAKDSCRAYEYRLTDNPERWHIMIAPGCELEEAACHCRVTFGERLLDIRRYTPAQA